MRRPSRRGVAYWGGSSDFLLRKYCAGGDSTSYEGGEEGRPSRYFATVKGGMGDPSESLLILKRQIIMLRRGVSRRIRSSSL
ncbi:hypothetical protein Plhal304r1_c006g0024721 [Plasmopara halstedii]